MTILEQTERYRLQNIEAANKYLADPELYPGFFQTWARLVLEKYGNNDTAE